MGDAKKISDELSAAGQVAPEDLKQASEEGFKSVLNLRVPGESGSLPNEQQHAEAVGLEYANVPLQPSTPDDELVAKALDEIDQLPKPILLHCGAGLRAGAIALIATAKAQNWTLEQLTEKAQEAGLSLDQPHLKQFIQQNYSQQS
jgi:uncharacterized protein (TIGR01244 family)